jgi:hypothetical protein
MTFIRATSQLKRRGSDDKEKGESEIAKEIEKKEKKQTKEYPVTNEVLPEK